MYAFNLPMDRIMSKMAEEMKLAETRRRQASKILLGNLETAVAQTPYNIVYQEDRVRLKHYRCQGETKYKTPLLIVYALINRETMLDLEPGRSVVQKLLDQGIDLYIMEWGYPKKKDRFQGIDDHVNGYINNVVNFVRKKTQKQKINLMGICMGGTFSVIYTALYPHKIKNLITTVTPTNFDTTQGLLHIWMKYMDADELVDALGNISSDLMNFGFLLLNPARLMIDKYVGFMSHMDQKNFVENFVRMEKWIFDSPDLPGEVFREFIKDFYKENKLIQNRLVIGGKRVDLTRITMPLLNIYAKYDHLVPPMACSLLTETVGSSDTRDICLDTGHIGIYVSSKTQDTFAPAIAAWLKERDILEKAAA